VADVRTLLLVQRALQTGKAIPGPMRDAPVASQEAADAGTSLQ
jgi:hypothetical protein